VDIFNLIGCTIIAFAYGWKLTLVALFAALPVILAGAIARGRYEKQFESMNAKVFRESSQFSTESIRAFRTVAALTLEDKILHRYRILLDEHVRNAFRRAPIAVLVFALAESVELCAIALTFWYGGQLLAAGEYSVEAFLVVYVAVVLGGQAAGQTLGFVPNLTRATAAANRILSCRGKSEVRGEPWTADNVCIEFHDVGFQYPTRDVPVFRHLSLDINQGAYVAVVGPSGCGKTTIISLLERFYQPSSGDIRIGGIPLAQCPLGAYRQQVALVAQEPTLFAGTVRENLVLGLADEPSDDDIQEATQAAEIHDFITSLPDGYGTELASGTHASLSGGQKQRMCIARALLRKPKLLLLDEATSSLDSESEALVQRAIDRVAASGRVTIVVIAHRLATVQNAQRIVALGEGGNIVEEGSHADLVRQKGAYWSMCKAQALDR
jgi:ABC-type multidrug transport system fused ATPase/permease subunit